MGKYDAWIPVFEELAEDPTVLVLEGLAELVPGGLPESAYKYQAWWASAHSHAVWKRFGWRASPDFSTGEVTFRRTAAPSAIRVESNLTATDPSAARLILLGCVETKLDHPASAKDLYASPLWKKRRRYAEQAGMPWRILSAEYGLVAPEDVIAPYDRYLGSEPSEYRTSWSQETAVQVIGEVRRLGMGVVEVHAGSDYLENGLIRELNKAGIEVLWPLRGYRFGEHLSWYDSQFSEVHAHARLQTPSPLADPEIDKAAEARELAGALRDLADRVERLFEVSSVVAGPVGSARDSEIVDVLLLHAEDVGGLVVADGDPAFTPDPAANAFLARDSFAFLLAVIADYQIPAERAWAVPWELKKRLGHLDPKLMLQDPDALYQAFDQRPKLHRFVRNVPGFFLEACDIVLKEYEGDAGQLWGDEPTAVELQKRLVVFPGISQKKAAMAVEILERDLGVHIREMEGSDLAFDVHVRRVMLRTGLATVDDQQHMIEQARRLNPDRPGALDFPMWNIGRTWCHAGVPECEICVLVEVCPKLIDAASGVRGA